MACEGAANRAGRRVLQGGRLETIAGVVPPRFKWFYTHYEIFASKAEMEHGLGAGWAKGRQGRAPEPHTEDTAPIPRWIRRRWPSWRRSPQIAVMTQLAVMTQIVVMTRVAVMAQAAVIAQLAAMTVIAVMTQIVVMARMAVGTQIGVMARSPR